jgi:TfoX/Sxy family transcriptional regulator of competence genes
MASTQNFVDYVCEQVSLAGKLSCKKMFGEYAMYLDEKVIALICDNQVFVKPTAEGKRLIGSVTETPPYPGAKPHYLVSAHLEDREFMTRLFLVTAAALPVPKPKSQAKAKSALKLAAKKSPRGKAGSG